MKKNIVSKFGGSSVEDAIQIEKVRKIVEDSSSRRYIVVSAPGREKKYNIKITDHLFNIATEGNHLRANRKKIGVNDFLFSIFKFRKIPSGFLSDFGGKNTV